MPYRRLKLVKAWIDLALAPLMRRLYGWGVRPVHFTLLSLPAGLLGVLLLFRRPEYSFPLILSYVILDVLDGTMARVTGSESVFGARLDFGVDRIVACCFALAYYIETGDLLFSGTAVVLIVAISLEEAGLIRNKNQ
jgi:phosphatidylglycerophosphate synthase